MSAWIELGYIDQEVDDDADDDDAQPPPPSPLTYLPTYIHTYYRYGGMESHALPLAEFSSFLCMMSHGGLEQRLIFLFQVGR